MEDCQQRVVEDRGVLEEKIARLIDFMHGDIYADLSATDQGLLMVQLVGMQNYSDALFRRIESFG